MTKILICPNSKHLQMTKMKFCLGRVENIVVTGETAGYKHFLLVQVCFSKAIVFRISKSPDYLVHGHEISIQLIV